jgi:hypothetical protein
MSTRISMRSSIVPRPVMYSVFRVEPRSGVGLIWSGVSVVTSDTASTTMPTTRVPILRMMTTVNGPYSGVPSEKRMRMSTIGTMMPRRLSTPLTNSGALAIRVGAS